MNVETRMVRASWVTRTKRIGLEDATFVKESRVAKMARISTSMLPDRTEKEHAHTV